MVSLEYSRSGRFDNRQFNCAIAANLAISDRPGTTAIQLKLALPGPFVQSSGHVSIHRPSGG
jgi:hypothetical protein